MRDLTSENNELRETLNRMRHSLQIAKEQLVHLYNNDNHMNTLNEQKRVQTTDK